MLYNALQVESILSGLSHGKKAQHGYDVTLKSIDSLEGEGRIYFENKNTTTPEYVEMKAEEGLYRLTPGYYRVTFNEGGKIPQGSAGFFKTRSSLVRCGTVVESGLYDAGFQTEFFGGFLIVHKPITIEQNARLAQFLLIKAEDVEKEYEGQWQNK